LAIAVIESGVVIPMFSRWFGHNEGGVLAMKTYGHLHMEMFFLRDDPGVLATALADLSFRIKGRHRTLSLLG